MNFDHAKLKALIPSLKGKRVLVIGDVMADHYVWGRVERISPEAPIPVVHVNREEVKLGGAANVACNIAVLGGSVTLAGIIGADAMGDTLIKLLKEAHISPDGLVKDAGRPTIQKTRVMAQHQQVVRVDRELNQALDAKVAEQFSAVCIKAVASCDAVLFSDYAKGALSAALAAAVIAEAHKLGKVVAADPKPANIGFFRGSDIVTPNQGEAQAVVGFQFRDDASVEEAGQKIRSLQGIRSVLITRGEHGMSLVSDGPAVHIPTRAQRVFDVTGAGDTVIATLTLALAAKVPAPEACALANTAAGIVVGEVGVATVTAEQLDEAL